MSLASLNAKIRSGAASDYELPVEIGLGVDGERLGAALVAVAVERWFDRLKAGEVHAFQFLTLVAHFTAVGLSLLEEEVRFTREGRSPELVGQFARRARSAYRQGVVAFMDGGFSALEGVLKGEHVEIARHQLPAMLGAHLFPNEPHPFSDEQKRDMVELFAGLEVLVRANLQARLAA